MTGPAAPETRALSVEAGYLAAFVLGGPAVPAFGRETRGDPLF